MVLQRTPLANATLSLWSYLLNPSVLDEIFQKHRGRSFEDILKFSTFVELIRDALILHKGSGRASFQRAEEQGTLPTCQEAVYHKLGRVPIPLSLGFFEDASQELREVLPRGNQVTAIPASLSGMTVTILDGKQLKNVAKRLWPLRCKPGKVVGGKILVAYLPAEGVAVAMAAVPDGEANDIRLMPEVVPRARARIPGIRLWVADRQFCDLNQPALLTEQGDHFLIRRSLKTHFHPDPQRPAQTSRDAQGRTVVEEWGWIGAVKDKRRRYVRHIRLIRPGEEEILLVTDLLDNQQYPASDLLAVYLTRWGIEARVPADHGGLRVAPSDRLHARGDDLSSGLLPGDLQSAASDTSLCGGQPGGDASGCGVGGADLRGRAKGTDRIDRVVPIPDDCRLVCNGNVA